MSEQSSSLYTRRKAAGLGPWAEPYGGADSNFEVSRYHDGYYLDGIHRGKEVHNVIDLFHGVLCRIIRPDHPRLKEAERMASEVGTEHIGKTDMHPIIVGLMERLQAAYFNALGKKGKVLLGVTGSGINGMAYRLARGFTRGGQPILLENAYHGSDVFGNATVGALGWHGEFSPLLEGETADARKERHTPNGDIHSFVRKLQVYKSRKERPVFYFEDIQGVGGGFANPGEAFLTEALHETGVHNGVGINDNVQTGMRRGHYISPPAWLRGEVATPLIVTLSKALANGAPLAAALVPEEIAQDLEKNPKCYGLHWDTFDSNVRSAALASAVHDVYEEEQLGASTPQIREALLKPIRAAAEERPDIVKEIRGDDLLIGVALQTPEQIAQAVNTAPEFGVKVGKGTDAIRIAPLADTPITLAQEAGERVARLLDSLPAPPAA